MTMVHDLTAFCGTSGVWFPFAMLLAGLAGSATHCVPMCGPFVLGQTAERLALLPACGLCEMSRLRGALLLPYHAGRLSTYAALGAVAGGLGAPAAGLGWARAPALLLAGAGLLFAWRALRRAAPPRWRLNALGPARMPRRLVALAGRIDRRRWTGGAMLGVLLGFLPCGLLYTALLAATAAGGALPGALAMLAFGLGTVPALVATGFAGHALRGVTAQPLRRFAAAGVLGANAAILWMLAWRLLAAPV